MNDLNAPYGQPPDSEGSVPPEPGRLERHFNWFNDQKWNWVPLLSLRPEHHDYVTAGVILRFACFAFGPISCVGGLFLFFTATDILGLWLEPAVWLGIFGGVTSLTVAVTHQYVSFHFWNRRAFRLRRQPGFRPTPQHAQTVTAHTDSPYRPPSTGELAFQEPDRPPLPLRHVASLLEVVFVQGTLVALTQAVSWSWSPVGPGQLSAEWQTVVRLAPLVSAALLTTGLILLGVSDWRPLQWAALTLRGVGVTGIAVMALLATVTGLLQVDGTILLLIGVTLSLMTLLTFGHCLLQLTRVLKAHARQQRTGQNVAPIATGWTGPAAAGEQP